LTGGWRAIPVVLSPFVYGSRYTTKAATRYANALRELSEGQNVILVDDARHLFVHDLPDPLRDHPIDNNLPAVAAKPYLLFPAALVSIAYAAAIERFVEPYFKKLRRKFRPELAKSQVPLTN
jgi:hypothetical protein